MPAPHSRDCVHRVSRRTWLKPWRTRNGWLPMQPIVSNMALRLFIEQGSTACHHVDDRPCRCPFRLGSRVSRVGADLPTRRPAPRLVIVTLRIWFHSGCWRTSCMIASSSSWLVLRGLAIVCSYVGILARRRGADVTTRPRFRAYRGHRNIQNTTRTPPWRCSGSRNFSGLIAHPIMSIQGRLQWPSAFFCFWE
jgi:hypothetical protein